MGRERGTHGVDAEPDKRPAPARRGRHARIRVDVMSQCRFCNRRDIQTVQARGEIFIGHHHGYKWVLRYKGPPVFCCAAHTEQAEAWSAAQVQKVIPWPVK